ncbi:MAG: hypothetical protein EBY76_10885 [Betaproteobacteria bacterium]|nr:hypothetical protein [Betaproteobacteria bacterium]
MRRSINAFLTALSVLAAPLDALRAQALDSVPRPLVSQPMLAMQAVDKARAHWRAGRLAQALQAVEAGLREEPQDLSLRFMRGSLLYESGRVDESRLQFIELAEQFPELAEIHNNLASLHARAGELELARLSLERALQAQPAYALAWENLAAVLARQSVEAIKRAQQHVGAAEKTRMELKLKSASELSERLLKP